MNKRTFVKKYFEFLKQSKTVANQVRVSYGGALLMMGLRDSTDDLDLDVTKETYERLVTTYNLKREMRKVGECADWNQHVSLKADDDLSRGVFIHDVWVSTPEDVLRRKEALNRPKDQDDIVKLKRLIESHSSGPMKQHSWMNW
jgi:hypothetical protein